MKQPFLYRYLAQLFSSQNYTVPKQSGLAGAVLVLILSALFYGQVLSGGQLTTIKTQLPRLSTASYVTTNQHCSDENEAISVLITQLSANEYQTRERAQERLILLAQTSAAQRKLVVGALLAALNPHDLKYKMDARQSYLWANGAEILSHLQAVEAIDLFIECLKCSAPTEYASDNYRHLPAVRALMNLSTLAQPQLIKALYDNDDPALYDNDDPQMRGYAALCLGRLGSNAVHKQRTRAALEQALNTETDYNVRLAIEGAIATIDRATK